MAIEEEEAVAQYAALLETAAAARRDMRAHVMQPRHALPFLQPGRLVRVLAAPEEGASVPPVEELPGDGERVRAVLARSLQHCLRRRWSAADLRCLQITPVASTSGRGGEAAVWGAVVNFERLGKAEAGEAEARAGTKQGARYIVDVLANCAQDSVPGHGPRRCGQSPALLPPLFATASAMLLTSGGTPARAGGHV